MHRRFIIIYATFGLLIFVQNIAMGNPRQATATATVCFVNNNRACLKDMLSDERTPRSTIAYVYALLGLSSASIGDAHEMMRMAVHHNNGDVNVERLVQFFDLWMAYTRVTVYQAMMAEVGVNEYLDGLDRNNMYFSRNPSGFVYQALMNTGNLVLAHGGDYFNLIQNQWHSQMSQLEAIHIDLKNALRCLMVPNGSLGRCGSLPKHELYRQAKMAIVYPPNTEEEGAFRYLPTLESLGFDSHHDYNFIHPGYTSMLGGSMNLMYIVGFPLAVKFLVLPALAYYGIVIPLSVPQITLLHFALDPVEHGVFWPAVGAVTKAVFKDERDPTEKMVKEMGGKTKSKICTTYASHPENNAGSVVCHFVPLRR